MPNVTISAAVEDKNASQWLLLISFTLIGQFQLKTLTDSATRKKEQKAESQKNKSSTTIPSLTPHPLSKADDTAGTASHRYQSKPTKY
jgi:hypothetical protein